MELDCPVENKLGHRSKTSSGYMLDSRPHLRPLILISCLKLPYSNRIMPAALPCSRHHSLHGSSRLLGLLFYRGRAAVQSPCEAKCHSLRAQISALMTHSRHFHGASYRPMNLSWGERRFWRRLAETHGFSSSRPTRWALREALISSNGKQALEVFLMPPMSLVSTCVRRMTYMVGLPRVSSKTRRRTSHSSGQSIDGVQFHAQYIVEMSL